MVPFDISIVDDTILEENESFDIVIMPKSLSNGIIRGSPGRATVTIVDDDCKQLLKLVCNRGETSLNFR